MAPRPGTKHAKQVYECLSSRHFSLTRKKTILHTFLKKYDEAVLIKSKKKQGGNAEFIKEDKWINNDMPREVNERGFMTRDELIRLMNWKLHHGKFRGTLKGNIQKNTAASVQSISKITVDMMKKVNADTESISEESKKNAIKQFSKLVSVGPATASAFLSFMYPKNFAFMSDEPLEAITGRREWKLNEYLSYNEIVIEISEQFNDENITPLQIEKALWCAGQIGFDSSDNDHSDGSSSSSKRKSANSGNTNNGSGGNKRRKA